MSVNKLYGTSEELYQLTRKEEITRGAAIKAVWDYAKKNDLKVKGGIQPDGDLIPIFGKKAISTTDVMKKIGKHLIKLEE